MGLELGRGGGLACWTGNVVGGVVGAGAAVMSWVAGPASWSGSCSGCVGARDVCAGVADPEDVLVVVATVAVSLDGKEKYPTGMPTIELSMF